MFNHSSIRTELYGLVGFKQGIQSDYKIITDVNIASSSGMYFQDYHPLITIENLRNIAPEDLSDKQFNEWLADIVQGTSVKIVNQLLAKYRPKSKWILENFRLYNYANVMDNKYSISGDAFLGYEIELAHMDNIMMIIDSIGLHFDADDTFNIYVFHSSNKDPIYTIEVTPEQDDEVWESQTAKYLEHITSSYAGGKFYIGYLQQDLGSSPILREWDRANIATMAHFARITPIKVNDHNSATLFDIDNINYSSDTWGLNFAFTIQTNLTRQISVQKSVLTNLVGYGVAVEILERIANSIRDNRIKTETRDLAYSELNSEMGLKNKYAEELKTVHLDFAGIHETFPKKSRISSVTAK